MSGSRFTKAREAITKFIEAMYTHDRGAIVGFAFSASVYSEFTGDKLSLKNSLSTMSASGGTFYYAATAEEIREFEALDCLVLYGDSRKFSLSSISDITLYEDIKGLLPEECTYIDDIEILKNFKSLEFFKPNNSVTDEDIKRIKEMHPNCEIYGR